MVRLLVTYMEQLEAPAGPPPPRPAGTLGVRRESVPQGDYLALYRAIGEPVQWDQRLRMPTAELAAFLRSPSTGLFILRQQGHAAGLCEFVAFDTVNVELTHFGLLPAAQGRGLGPYLLNAALRRVWERRPDRVWLHTDTNDHPKARATYERAGFKVFAEKWVDFPD